MKKSSFLFFLALMCCHLPLFSQLQPKTLFATGNGSLFSNFDRYLLQEYNARAGILLDENLTLGGFGERRQFDRFNSSGPDVTAQYFGLFTRYFFKGAGPANFFLEGEAFFGSRDFNFDVDELNFSRGAWGFYLGGGQDWFLSPTAAIEGRAGVQWSDEEESDARTNILANIGLAFFLPPDGESLGRTTPGLTDGMLMIGGSGSFRWDVSNSGAGSDPVIAIQPLFGLQVHPRWMVGGEFSYTRGQQVVGGGVILEEYDLSVGLHPFIRLYLNPADKFKVFAEGMAGAAYQDHGSHSHYPFRLRGSAGLDFFLSSNMALEAFVGYQGVRDLDEGSIWEDNLVGGVGLRVFLWE